jgi:aspartokinase-like uncharacterized kinase
MEALKGRDNQGAGYESPAIVYKIGGSVLTLPDLPQRLEALLALRPRSRPLVIVGGGEAADLVRRWDGVHRLGQGRAHNLALWSMRLTEALIMDLLPEAVDTHSRADADAAWRARQIPVLCAAAFVHAEEALIRSATKKVGQGKSSTATDASHREPASAFDRCLPCSWDVTSDSIAAWVTCRWPADELVLVKSVPCPGSTDGDPQSAAKRGLVDAYFPQLAPRVPRISWLNLRAATPRIEHWLPTNSGRAT